MNNIVNMVSQSTAKEQDLVKKKKFLEERKIESQYSQVMERLSSEQSLDITDDDKVFDTGSITKANEEYVEAIANRMPFINNTLSEFICLGGKTVYLIGGCTGQGKSTTVANIVEPVLDKGKRVLVITNEEAREDVYNRVACQRLGKSFRLYKRGKLHPEENARVSQEAESLQSVLTVISTEFKNNPDFVTTPQGIAQIFEKFAFDHDLVLLDYYQNINHSVASAGDTRPEPHVHQEKFAYWLNHFKNRYGKPIVIFSQLKRQTKNEAHAFEDRVMGRKYIATVSLVHIEVSPDFTNYTTTFRCHKDRFWGMAGKGMVTGFDWTSNRFVKYDESFQAKAAQWSLEDQKHTTDVKETEDDTGNETTEEQGLDSLVLDDLI